LLLFLKEEVKMTVALTSPVTGSAQTGLTSPTYTHVADVAPSQNAKQWAVTALGGTQTGVRTHSVASPFTVSVFRPQNPQVLAPVNAVTGVLNKIPTNTYHVVVRKGVLPLAGQAYKPMIIRGSIEVPAGADVADQPNIEAGISLFIGALSQVSAGLGDTARNGVL